MNLQLQSEISTETSMAVKFYFLEAFTNSPNSGCLQEVFVGKKADVTHSGVL